MNIDNFLATHANSLNLRARRTKILATNIANAETPNYKAKDLVFAEVLRDAGGPNASKSRLAMTDNQSLLTTNAMHIGGSRSTLNSKVMYREPLHASLDGNTVDKDQEQARFAENTIRYQASLEFINSRVSGLIRALKGE
jgi:flagellar basal-body rod protein FlgB